MEEVLILSRHLSGDTEKNYRKPQSVQSVSETRFSLDTSQPHFRSFSQLSLSGRIAYFCKLSKRVSHAEVRGSFLVEDQTKT
jgi:hypothetical protein